MDDLKSCPFCGGDGRLHRRDLCSETVECDNYSDEEDFPGCDYFVECDQCDSSSHTSETKLGAIAAWNQRAEPNIIVRDEVKLFSESMENILKKNDHKGGWKNESIEYLMKRLKDEVNELEMVLDFGVIIEEKQSECVDVSNFAMMIFDVLSLKRGQ